MNKKTSVVSATEVTRLGAVIGCDWRFVAGEAPSPDFYTPVDVVVGTAADVFTVYSEAVGVDSENLDIPDRTIEWTDDLTVRNRSARQFIPIAQLT